LKLKISTPSRLQFGIIDMRGDLRRIHGSVGVTIKKPRLILEIEESSETRIFGARSNRAHQILDFFYKNYNIPSGVLLDIQEDIPEHTGFGSGTQLALALGTSLNKIFNLDLTIHEIAVKLQRSRVSGIGTLGFLNGGFIIDGGHSTENLDKVPPLVYRQDFPDDWSFIVCIPNIKRGFSGEQEQNAFKKLEPPPIETIGLVSRIVLLQMIPAIIEKDIELFGEAMTKLDTMFGDYWKKIQGGTYSHPRIEECVKHLLEKGAYGAGQSSWGPALYGLVDGRSQANNMLDEMNSFLNEGKERGSAFITSADNVGAQIIEV
jgi:beta-ribofuranosylaminobenzene 5'-phosphate synthase